jgi:hypothetical protein
MAVESDAEKSRWPFVLMCDGLFVLSTFLPWLKVWKAGSPNFWTIMVEAPMTLGFTMLVGITGAFASTIYTLIVRHRLQFAHLMYFTVIQALAPGTLVFMALARPYSDDAEIPFLLALITTAYKPVIAFQWPRKTEPSPSLFEDETTPAPHP